MSEPSFTITALQAEDIPACARLGAAAFEDDRHTQLKALAANPPYDHGQGILDSFPSYITHPRVVALKAVDNASGDLMGFIIWNLRGFKPQEIPDVPGRPQSVEPTPSAKTEQSEDDNKAEEEDEEKKKAAEDGMQRLARLNNEAMNDWLEAFMPDGVRALCIIGLTVSPVYQGRGVGSALVRWGTKVCDKEDVLGWVHASDPSWRMYEKSGFEVKRVLDHDLDAYAPCPPPAEEGPDAKWGHYVFRCMIYNCPPDKGAE